MAKIIKAPEEWLRTLEKEYIFLVGDWPSEAIDMLSDLDIEWNYKAFNNADCILFWFGPGKSDPSELSNYGRILFQENQSFYVGCHTEYEHRAFIKRQTELVDDITTVHNDLKDLINNYKSDYKEVYDA